MPRSNVAFKRILDPRHKIRYSDEIDDEEDIYEESDDDASLLQLEKIERRLKSKKKQSKSTKSKNFEIVIEDETDVIAIETIPAEVPVRKNSESEYEDSIQGDNDYSTETVIKRSNSKRQRQPDSTFNSWNDLDYDDQKVELPRSCFVEPGPTPWSNFNGHLIFFSFIFYEF